MPQEARPGLEAAGRRPADRVPHPLAATTAVATRRLVPRQHSSRLHRHRRRRSSIPTCTARRCRRSCHLRTAAVSTPWRNESSRLETGAARGTAPFRVVPLAVSAARRRACRGPGGGGTCLGPARRSDARPLEPLPLRCAARCAAAAPAASSATCARSSATRAAPDTSSSSARLAAVGACRMRRSGARKKNGGRVIRPPLTSLRSSCGCRGGIGGGRRSGSSRWVSGRRSSRRVSSRRRRGRRRLCCRGSHCSRGRLRCRRIHRRRCLRSSGSSRRFHRRLRRRVRCSSLGFSHSRCLRGLRCPGIRSRRVIEGELDGDAQRQVQRLDARAQRRRARDANRRVVEPPVQRALRQHLGRHRLSRRRSSLEHGSHGIGNGGRGERLHRCARQCPRAGFEGRGRSPQRLGGGGGGGGGDAERDGRGRKRIRVRRLRG